MLIAAAGDAAFVHHDRTVVEVDQFADDVISAVLPVRQAFGAIHPGRNVVNVGRYHFRKKPLLWAGRRALLIGQETRELPARPAGKLLCRFAQAFQPKGLRCE